MSSTTDQHKLDKKFLQLHVKTESTEGGACLTRHISSVSHSSCSHRWQGLQRAANEDRSYYNGKRPGWDVVASKSWKPYQHQAHHIIPNAVLNDSIAVAATYGDIAIYTLLRMGLLEAKYNLNHKSNMIVLPMDVKVASILRLPRHLRPNEQSHDAYSAMVKARIQPVMNDYAKLIKESREKTDHPPPPDKLAKAKLQRVSAQMRAIILTWGNVVPGIALEDHDPR